MSNQKALSLVCNFGSIAMALIANFLATSKDDENEDEDEDDNINFEQTLAANLLDEWAFLYNDPDVHDPDQIYWSEFMLEMIKSAHMNAMAGFLDVVIAACAASLERALNFVAKPKASSNDQSISTSSAKGSTTKGRRILPLKHNKSSGKDSTAASTFSEANCGLATAEYYQSLKRRGTKYTMDTISLVCQRQEAIQKLKNAPAEDLKPKARHALLLSCFFNASRKNKCEKAEKKWNISNEIY
ncbi:hypothetical protein DFJ58DRAFT_850332 [Suillus subalutaceus]|uniref:uncharacterized protein n=1 Tax=Suillus subalutaceus TaxID=48586 RepID=UPI001B882F4F|nr:uncharacterized protein DFJ58DRAFT_850332 [Suillus subalutaceus]KAG1817410.1 hypothetical protein DFJ58DRAFT_850332 [Suillus subalutaceus]